jgi:hypothetical protein
VELDWGATETVPLPSVATGGKLFTFTTTPGKGSLLDASNTFNRALLGWAQTETAAKQSRKKALRIGQR